MPCFLARTWYLYIMKTNYTIYENGNELFTTSNVSHALDIAQSCGLTIVSNYGLPSESILVSFEGKNV